MKQMFLLLLLFFATSCVSQDILTKDMGNANIFVLSPLNVAAEDGANIGGLAVTLPKASPGLDTNRITVFRSDMVLDYYAGAKWALPLPQIIQRTFQESFENARRFHVITDDLSTIETDYELQLDIRDFHVQLLSKSQSQAVVKLGYRLLDNETQTLLLSGVVNQIEPINKQGLQLHLTQLNQAFFKAQQALLGAILDSHAAAVPQEHDVLSPE